MLISTLFMLSTLFALGHSAGINILPQGAATELKHCASASGWYSSNIRWGYNGDARNDQNNIRRHTANFKRKMTGIISSGVVDKIKDMFKYSSWHTANTRVGYHSDARRDRDTVNRLYSEIVNSGELSATLVSNIRGMGWAAAWFSANTRIGYSADARNDARRLNEYFDSIRGSVELVRLNFLNDDLRVTETAPSVVFTKRLPNCGSTNLQTECSYEENVGRTISYTHEVGFEYSITTGFTAGVSFIGESEISFEAGFTFSSSS